MRIGELSLMYGGVDRRTIDFYTNKGLLIGKPSPSSKYRNYDEDDVERLGKILIFREMGLSIEKIELAINDSSYWTAKRLDDHIAMLKENQARANERYAQMIRFAEAMKDTAMAPMVYLKTSGMSIDQFVKYWVSAYQWVKSNPDAYSEDSEDIAQLDDMVESFYSNMVAQKEKGYESQDVQGLIVRLSNRLQINYGIILYLAMRMLADSDALNTLIESDIKDAELDEADTNEVKAMLKDVILLCADWCRAAKCLSSISNIEAMKLKYSERLKKLSDEYNDDGSELISDMIGEMLAGISDGITKPEILQLFIGAIVMANSEMLEKREPGITDFILKAIDYYVVNNSKENEQHF